MSRLEKQTPEEGYSSTVRKVYGPLMNPSNGAEVVKSDTTEFEEPSVVFIGTEGDIAVTTWSGQDLIFKNLPCGVWLPMTVKKVLSTGTTTSDMVRAY